MVDEKPIKLKCYKCGNDAFDVTEIVALDKEKTLKITDGILLDVLNQACGNGEGEIDNRCTSAYEDACNYLKKKGYLDEVNSRIFNVNNWLDD